MGIFREMGIRKFKKRVRSAFADFIDDGRLVIADCNYDWGKAYATLHGDKLRIQCIRDRDGYSVDIAPRWDRGDWVEIKLMLWACGIPGFLEPKEWSECTPELAAQILRQCFREIEERLSGPALRKAQARLDERGQALVEKLNASARPPRTGSG